MTPSNKNPPVTSNKKKLVTRDDCSAIIVPWERVGCLSRERMQAFVITIPLIGKTQKRRLTQKTLIFRN